MCKVCYVWSTSNIRSDLGKNINLGDANLIIVLLYKDKIYIICLCVKMYIYDKLVKIILGIFINVDDHKSVDVKKNDVAILRVFIRLYNGN